MTRGQAERQCTSLNGKSREVTRHTLGNANAVNYWRGCRSEANFLISGGSETQRTDMLVRMLETYQNHAPIPVVLLTGSDLTEQAVIQSAQAERLGRVAVSSSRYPNYHALHQMDHERLCKLLLTVAQKKNYTDLDRLENYIKAFLAIAGRYYPPCLESLIKLDHQYPQNRQLQQLGLSAGVAQKHIEAIRAYPAGTNNLRNILDLLANSYRNLTKSSCGKVNLLTGFPGSDLLCININSPDPGIMDLALAAELEQLIESKRQFLLILNDVPLCDMDGLYTQVLRAKNVHSHVCVGICTHNAHGWAAAVPQVLNPEDGLLNNIQNFVLLHNANESDGDLEKCLKYLGTYLKHEVIYGGGHGAEFIPIWNSGNWTVQPVGMHNRVMPEDMNGFAVLLKGHRSRYIDLYRGITI